MKKLISILLSCILIITLVGCGSESKEATKQNETLSADLNITDYAKKIPGIKVTKVNDCIKDNGFVLIQIKHTTDSKKTLIHDCYVLLKELKNCNDFKKIKKLDVMIMADFNDKYGKSIEGKSFSCTFNKSELDKINWDNFLWKNTIEIATDVWIHPTLH